MCTYRQILESIYLLQIIIELLTKKKLSIVFTYTERLKELFFQKFTQNLFNSIKAAMPISRDLHTSNFASFKKGVSHGNADRIAQKNLSIVFTYTERLKELLF